MKEMVNQKNPEKSSSRVAINSFMMGSLFFILTLILTLGFDKFNPLVIWELVLAIPLLFISSMAYAKIGYHSEHKLFDEYGWITTTLGINLMLNVVGLLALSYSRALSLAFFILVFVLILGYYGIKIRYQPKGKGEVFAKLIFILVILLIGGVLPALVY